MLRAALLRLTGGDKGSAVASRRSVTVCRRGHYSSARAVYPHSSRRFPRRRLNLFGSHDARFHWDTVPALREGVWACRVLPPGSPPAQRLLTVCGQLREVSHTERSLGRKFGYPGVSPGRVTVVSCVHGSRPGMLSPRFFVWKLKPRAPGPRPGALSMRHAGGIFFIADPYTVYCPLCHSAPTYPCRDKTRRHQRGGQRNRVEIHPQRQAAADKKAATD